MPQESFAVLSVSGEKTWRRRKTFRFLCDKKSTKDYCKYPEQVSVHQKQFCFWFSVFGYQLQNDAEINHMSHQFASLYHEGNFKEASL